MKKLFALVGLAIFMVSWVVMAQDTSIGYISQPLMSVDDIKPIAGAEIEAFVAAIGGWDSLGVLGIVALVVQGLALAMRSFLGKFAGVYRLMILNGLTLVGGVLGLKIAGSDWVSALIHTQTLMTFQVFGNQVWKQLKKKNEDVADIKSAMAVGVTPS